MMSNLKMMNENLEKIKKVCNMYRREMTIYAAVIADHTDLCTMDEYIEFMNKQSMDVYIGNLFCDLFFTDSPYDDLLEGKETITDFHKKHLDMIDKDLFKKYEERLLREES